MSDKISMALDGIQNKIFDLWLWFTVGLIAVVSFFGRRLIRKWDTVVDSHMPAAEIQRQLSGVLIDMQRCEKRLRADHRREQQELTVALNKVGERVDDMYKILMENRP